MTDANRDLRAEFLTTLDGFAGAENSPAYFGYLGPEFERALAEKQGRPHALLMGRRTYEVMAPIASSGDYDDANRMAEIEKFVFSNTLKEPLEWANTSVIDGDLGDTIRALKASEGPELRTMGSATLVKGLLHLGLIDRLQLIVAPQVLGQTGKEPALAGAPDFDLELIESRVLDKRMLLLEYAPLADRHEPG